MKYSISPLGPDTEPTPVLGVPVRQIRSGRLRTTNWQIPIVGHFFSSPPHFMLVGGGKR